MFAGETETEKSYVMKLKLIQIFPLVFILMLAFPVASKSQIPDEIIISLNSGNAKSLSDYFNQTVELVILETDNVYSKAQAQQIVGKFFSDYQPEKFEILHQGGPENAKYVIGNLKTQKGTFRVYFLLKQDSNGKSFIHQLRIETQK